MSRCRGRVDRVSGALNLGTTPQMFAVGPLGWQIGQKFGGFGVGDVIEIDAFEKLVGL